MTDEITQLQEKIKNQKKSLNALNKKIHKLEWQVEYYKDAAEMAKRALKDETCKQLAEFLNGRINNG